MTFLPRCAHRPGLPSALTPLEYYTGRRQKCELACTTRSKLTCGRSARQLGSSCTATRRSRTCKTRVISSPSSSHLCASPRPFHDIFTISCIYVLNLLRYDRTQTSCSILNLYGLHAHAQRLSGCWDSVRQSMRRSYIGRVAILIFKTWDRYVFSFSFPSTLCCLHYLAPHIIPFPHSSPVHLGRIYPLHNLIRSVFFFSPIFNGSLGHHPSQVLSSCHYLLLRFYHICLIYLPCKRETLEPVLRSTNHQGARLSRSRPPPSAHGSPIRRRRARPLHTQR